MKRAIVALVLGCFVMAGLVSAEVFNIQNIDTGANGSITKEKASGEQFRKSKSVTRKYEYEGQTFIEKVEEEVGLFGKDKEWRARKETAYYTLKGTKLVPYQTEAVSKDKAGNVVHKQFKKYDVANKKALVNNDGKEKVFTLRDDMIGTEFLFLAMANYPYNEKRDFVFYLLTSEPTLYPMTMKYIGEETINTAGGEPVACHKIQMIPDLGFLNVVGAFVPKTYFWYTVSKPHQFVRYEGLDGGLGDPYIVREATIVQ